MGEQVFKFRHRDFALISLMDALEGPGGLSYNARLKKNPLFAHFFPTQAINKRGFINENKSEIIDEFLRRTGNVLSQINHDEFREYENMKNFQF